MVVRDRSPGVNALLVGDVELREAMRSASRRVRDLSGAEYAAVALVDRSNPASVVYESVSGLGLEDDYGTRIPLRGLTAAVMDAGEPILTDDLTHDARYDPPKEWRDALSALGPAMFTPLIADGEALGALIVGWRRGSPSERPEENRTAKVRNFAERAALTLQRAREQEERIRYEHWLGATSEMARLLLSEVDRDEAMCLVTRQLRAVSGADFAGIFLVDPSDSAHATVVRLEGLDTPVAPDLRIPREGHMAWVIESGKRVVSADWTRGPRYRPPPEWANALSVVGLGMMIPLIADKEILGVLFVGWRSGSPHEFAALGEVEQVQTFADLAAVALQRVRAQGDRAHLMLLEDRNLIARDLNDVVLQRVFAAALGLKSIRRASPDAQLQQRLDQTIASLEEVNQEIRSAVFRVRPDVADG